MIVGFSYPRSFKFSSWLITKVLGTKYSHTFLIFNIFENNIVFEADRYGVRAVNLELFLKKNYVIKNKVMEDTTAMDGLKYCLNHLGKKYSFISNFAILFGFKFKDNERKFICSELVARAIGINIKNLDLVTPKDIEYYLWRKLDE